MTIGKADTASMEQEREQAELETEKIDNVESAEAEPKTEEKTGENADTAKAEPKTEEKAEENADTAEAKPKTEEKAEQSTNTVVTQESQGKGQSAETAIALEAEPYVISMVKKERKPLPVGWKICMTVCLGLVLVYLAGTAFFATHFGWDTTLNGVDVSLMSAAHARDAVYAFADHYRLEIQERGDEKEYLQGADIDLHIQLQGTIQECIRQQNPFLWFYPADEREFTMDTQVTYDTAKLYQNLNDLHGMQREYMTPPVEPQIVRKFGTFIVEKSQEGRQLLPYDVRHAVRTAIEDLETSVNLETAGCYAAPQYDVDDPAILKAVSALEALQEAKIIYRFAEEEEVLQGERILNWISISDDYMLSVDREDTQAYVEHLIEEYEIRGESISFETSDGKTVQVTSYVRSSDLDTAAEAERLEAMILELAEGSKQVMVRKSSELMEIGDTYIEINLTTQHLYGYKDGKLILETDIVSGLPSTGCATPAGVYRIRSKSSPAILVGETYRTPVSYWMPFNGGIGLHDATWQSSFGGTRYLSNGSHGCINLPLQMAKEIYENYDAGDIVVLYHGSTAE